MKIKVIDIMNKIHNEENVPKQIKYDMKTYFYDETCQDYTDYDRTYGLFSDLLDKQYGIFSCLNDEVEIIEEEKKIPEKLNIEDDGNAITLFGEKENEWTILDNVDVIICNKINSIIDYLKSKGDE